MDEFVALFNCTPENAALARHSIVEHFEGCLSSDARFELEVAVGEILTNCVVHGCPGGGTVGINAFIDGDALMVSIKDSGDGFDAASVPARPESLRAGGYGLNIVRALVDELRFEERGTRVILVKRVIQ